MILNRIPLKGDMPESVRRQIDLQELKVINATLVLVPDEDTLHELQGLSTIYGKKVIARILEPGKELIWDGSMSSPWHVNTDSYVMTFDTSPKLQTPHLLFNCL